MRIIAGEFRSRRILAPAGPITRPITDRAKQSLFDILGGEMEDAIVYDCFAGTGSMGLECLSRGARHVTFFESDRSAGALLRRNIVALGVQRRCKVIDRNLFRWIESSEGRGRTQRAGLVFLDPPYRFLRERAADLQQLAVRLATDHVSPGGLVVFRHDAADALHLPPLATVESRTYGQMAIELLRAPISG
jgi:16S rRNA (guanine966-N2)-methyltransferase